MKDTMSIGIRKKEDFTDGILTGQSLEVYDTKTGDVINGVYKAEIKASVDDIVKAEIGVFLTGIDLPGMEVEIQELEFKDRRTDKKFKLSRVEE